MEALAKFDSLGTQQSEMRHNQCEPQTHLMPFVRTESRDGVISYHIVFVPHVSGKHPVIKRIAYRRWLFLKDGHWYLRRTYSLESESR